MASTKLRLVSLREMMCDWHVVCGCCLAPLTTTTAAAATAAGQLVLSSLWSMLLYLLSCTAFHTCSVYSTGDFYDDTNIMSTAQLQSSSRYTLLPELLSSIHHINNFSIFHNVCWCSVFQWKRTSILRRQSQTLQHHCVWFTNYIDLLCSPP